MPTAPPSPDTLEDLLSEPTDAVLNALRRCPGDIVFLGIGGKMGPSMARMAQRAGEMLGEKRRIFGVSRFSDETLPQQLSQWGIEPVTCDLLDASAVEKLPDAPWVVFMTGMKFGGSQNAGRMWAMNTLAPAHVCRRYASGRFVVFSTGNVYPYTTPAAGGSRESDVPQPVGEYGMSALGRERTFEYFSRDHRVPVSIVRLNYACDLRYGVLVDLAVKIWNGDPVDLAMGWFNTIWQGDANAQALAVLAHAASPPFVLNVTGPEILSVREVCETMAGIMDKPVRFESEPEPQALLNHAGKALELFGPPRVNSETLIRWVAHWVMEGRPLLGKATHYENRSGRF